jgi:hypothetical protein
MPCADAEEKPLYQELSDKTALERIRGIYMKILNTPGETIKNVPFTSAYRVVVTDPAGKTVPGFTVSVSYPVVQAAQAAGGTAPYKVKTDFSKKYVSPVKRNSDGKYVCTLAADIYCIDMKDGSVIFRTQQTDTATDNSKFRAVDNCGQTVAAKTVHAVIYGM